MTSRTEFTGDYSSQTHDDLMSAIDFGLEMLLGKRLAKNITLDVDITDLSEEGIEGEALIVDDDARPRWFEIRLDSGLDRRGMVENMMHELVHVKQYARKELVQGGIRIDGRGIRLMKTKWMFEDYAVEGVDYWDLPWEIEAYGRQLGLFIRWVASRDEVDLEDWQI